jgi:signal transduction histidine kinase
MNFTKSVEAWIGNIYKKIWDNNKIAKRPLWFIIGIPVILAGASVWFKLQYFETYSPPYLSFFVVVMVSACYGGIRGALIGSVITTGFALVLYVAAVEIHDDSLILNFLQILLYFFESVFFTALLHRFKLIEVTNRQQYEIVSSAKTEIQDRERIHEDFVHMATHELKAPVTVLKAYLQLAEMKLKSTDAIVLPDVQTQTLQFNDLVGKMNFQLNKLVSLINDLLDSTKIKSGVLSCQMALFDLVKCIKDCVDGYSATQPEASIYFSQTSSNLNILGDHTRIEQVLLNLLSNAVKYANGKPEVLVTCEQKEDNIYVYVKDNGIGIPDGLRSEVFNRFYRVSSPEMRKFQGLGLGLYISAEIIKSHNGEIGVYSELGKGSTFWFSIPASKEII